MAEYIEREAVRLAYEKSFEKDTHRTEEASRIHAQEHRHILHLLDKIPAADVVEVVRCKNCKHRGTDECIFHIKGMPADKETLVKFDNDFCSYGERRDADD